MTVAETGKGRSGVVYLQVAQTNLPTVYASVEAVYETDKLSGSDYNALTAQVEPKVMGRSIDSTDGVVRMAYSPEQAQLLHESLAMAAYAMERVDADMIQQTLDLDKQHAEAASLRDKIGSQLRQQGVEVPDLDYEIIEDELEAYIP